MLKIVCFILCESESRSVVSSFVTPWTIQPLEFSRPEYWSGKPFPSPVDLPDPGIELRSPALQAHSLLTELSGKPILCDFFHNKKKFKKIVFSKRQNHNSLMDTKHENALQILFHSGENQADVITNSEQKCRGAAHTEWGL